MIIEPPLVCEAKGCRKRGKPFKTRGGLNIHQNYCAAYKLHLLESHRNWVERRELAQKQRMKDAQGDNSLSVDGSTSHGGLEVWLAEKIYTVYTDPLYKYKVEPQHIGTSQGNKPTVPASTDRDRQKKFPTHTARIPIVPFEGPMINQGKRKRSIEHEEDGHEDIRRKVTAQTHKEVAVQTEKDQHVTAWQAGARYNLKSCLSSW